MDQDIKPHTEEEDRAVVNSLMHRFVADDDPFNTYVVSHTGLLVEVTEPGGPGAKRRKKTLHVISMVNGSMATNPLDDFVCCINFDEYIMGWMENPRFHHRVVGIAYFNPATCRYQAEPLPYPGHPE